MSTNTIKNFYVRQTDKDVSQAKIQIDASQVIYNDMTLDKYLDEKIDKLWNWVASSKLYLKDGLAPEDLSFLWRLKQALTLEQGDDDAINLIKVNNCANSSETLFTITNKIVRKDNDEALYSQVQALGDYSDEQIAEQPDEQSTEYKMIQGIKYLMINEEYYAVGRKYQMEIEKDVIMVRVAVPQVIQKAQAPVIDLNYSFVENGMFK